MQERVEKKPLDPRGWPSKPEKKKKRSRPLILIVIR